MPVITHPKTLLALTLCMGFAGAPSHADIKEIPAEEMTEAYIKDTTVIVPKQQANDGQGQKAAKNVKISPNQVKAEGSVEQDPNNAPNKRPDLEPLVDNNLAKQQEHSLQQQQSQVNVPNLDLLQKNRDDNLRKVLTDNGYSLSALNIPATGPINYNTINLPSVMGNAGGNSVSSNPNQFIITIPTTKAGTNGLQNLTPGGEYQMQINNGQMQLIINRPQH